MLNTWENGQTKYILSESSIDIMCLTETHLSTNIYNEEIVIPNYSIVRRDRSIGPHGGALNYVKESYDYIHRMTLKMIVLKVSGWNYVFLMKKIFLYL